MVHGTLPAGRACVVRDDHVVLSQQNELREPAPPGSTRPALAPTCESRFKAPVHTAKAGPVSFLPGVEIVVTAPMIYFVHGPDTLLVRRHVREITMRFDPDGVNTTRVDGRSTPPHQIATMVATPAFFGGGRVIIVDDLFGGKSGRGSGGDDDDGGGSGSKAGSGALDLLDRVTEPNVLVLVEPSLASVPAAVKRRAPKLDVRSGVVPRGRELVSWVIEQAATLDAKIDQRAAQSLLDAKSPGSWQRPASNPRYDVPPNLDAIQQEIVKLATFCHPGAITEDAVRTMTNAGVADQLFPFLSALFGGDQRQAVSLLADALDRGEDHARLLAQVMQQAELSPPLEAASGSNPEEVGVDLGVSNPRRMHAIERSARQRPITPLLATITTADRDQKQGRLRNQEDVLFALLALMGTQQRTGR